MRQTLDALLERNGCYAAAFPAEFANLAAPPAEKLAVLTCMDARMLPDQILGTAAGDAHVIRNAGGRASEDAIRSLIISSRVLGTRTFVVIHHTDCGMAKMSEQQMREFMGAADRAAAAVAEHIEWLTIADPAQALLEDVRRIRNHPLVAGDIPVFGLTYDVKTGRLHALEAATTAGAPR